MTDTNEHAQELTLAQVFEPLARTLYNAAAAWAVVAGAPLIAAIQGPEAAATFITEMIWLPGQPPPGTLVQAGATWLEAQPAAGLSQVQPLVLAYPVKERRDAPPA